MARRYITVSTSTTVTRYHYTCQANPPTKRGLGEAGINVPPCMSELEYREDVLSSACGCLSLHPLKTISRTITAAPKVRRSNQGSLPSSTMNKRHRERLRAESGLQATRSPM